MWYHCNGEEPSWEVPEYESIASKAVRLDGFSRHEISAHIQEVPENGADVAHLNYLHTSPVVHFLSYFGITHLWSATWAPMSGKNSHTAQIELTQSLQFLGKWQVPGTALDVSIKQYGPGVVILQFNSKIGKFYIVQSVTPLEPMRQQIIHAVFTPWFIPRIVGKGLLWSVVDQVERDIPIWNNKTYRVRLSLLFLLSLSLSQSPSLRTHTLSLQLLSLSFLALSSFGISLSRSRFSTFLCPSWFSGDDC